MSLLEMSAAGAAVILAAAIVRAAAKERLPVGAFEAMWALAWARLMLPVRLPFRLSAWTLLRRLVTHTAVPGPLPSAALPGQTAPRSAGMLQNIPAAAPAVAADASIPTLTVLWLAGAAVCALAFALCYIRACRRFRCAEPIENSYVNQFLADHPLRRPVSVRVSDRIGAPLTYGTARPVILLPRSMDLGDRGTLGYVLAHELAHIRRLDAARKLALTAAVCLHWFDPLVWLMAALAGRDMERACDRAVVDAFGPEVRRDYAMALLDMEERRGGFAGLASGFSKNAIEERIHSIMKIRPRTFLSTLLAFALVLSVGAVFATAAPEDDAVADGADTPTDIVVSDDAPAVFSGDVMTSSDGTVYVFTDEGEPVSMTQREYKVLFEPVQVEWWTAEEYAAWLEQEKEDLQDCLGQRAWTSADGWFTWTQEKIDETIEMYEQVLDEIEDGLLVSKTVDGRSDVMLMQGNGAVRDDLYDGSEDGLTMFKYDEADNVWTYYMMTEADADAMPAQNEAMDAEREQLEQQLAQLEAEQERIERQLASIGDADEQWDRLQDASGSASFAEPPAEPEAEDGVQYSQPDEPPEPEAAQPVQGADGTVTVPPSENVTVFFEQTDGAPYGSFESGGRIRVGQATAAKGSTVSVSLTTRTDASVTVSLYGDITTLGRSVDLKAGQIQTVTFRPEQDDTFVIYLTNNSEYPVEFIVSYLVS